MAVIPLPQADAGSLIGGSRPEAVYVHVPFCRHKCHYCDFYSLVDARGRQDAFADRLEAEAAACSACVDSSRVQTVFVGGGTPTLLEPKNLRRVLAAVNDGFLKANGNTVEWTVEANPETVDLQCAQTLIDGGVNRVSIGCQSFDPELLKTLERHHNPESVPRAIDFFRTVGISRISLDLIFAVPGSTMQQWESDLEAALALSPSHLSCYGLTFEPGTPLFEKRRQGRIEAVQDDLQIQMYDYVRTRLAEEGYTQYEISNWAKPGEECLHNLLYWRNADWLPLGPAAAGHIQGNRWRNLPRLDDWLDSGPFSPIVELEESDVRRNTAERLMLGFRLTDGFQETELEAILKEDPLQQPSRTEAINKATEAGQLERVGGRIRFSPSGVLLADGFLSELL